MYRKALEFVLLLALVPLSFATTTGSLAKHLTVGPMSSTLFLSEKVFPSSVDMEKNMRERPVPWSAQTTYTFPSPVENTLGAAWSPVLEEFTTTPAVGDADSSACA